MDKGVTKYQHTQVGQLMLAVFFAVALLFLFVMAQNNFELEAFVVMLFILSIIASFVSLQVVVDGEYLRIKFGYGIFQKRFLLNEIVSVERVKNHWYYGWGIRIWFWPHMWIFNVSGFDAVEIKMKSGRVYRIGTDEPESFVSALTQAIR